MVTHRQSRLIFFVAVAAAVVALAIIGHCRLLRSVSEPPYPSQPLLSSVSGNLTLNADQPRLVEGLPICKSSKMFATAALPKPAAAALIALGAVTAGVVVKEWLSQLVVAAGRGPPPALAAALTGQDLLTRFCLARR